MPSVDRELQGERIYELFSRRLRSKWLLDFDDNEIDLIQQQASDRLAEFSSSPPDFIAIVTIDPTEFIAQLMAGWRLGIPLFLTNPHWGTAERTQFTTLTTNLDRNRHQWQIMIPTGGSTGKIKFAIHTWETFSASVWGFQEFYQVPEINSVCVLPLYHVSGLMQLMRSLLTGGKLLIRDFHQLFTEPLSINPQHYFISLVPTQLQKILDLDPILLAKFKTILLGGAPPPIELLNQARLAHLPLALTYGMTETASQITSLQPAEFLAGNHSCGKILPHVELELINKSIDGVGAIAIKSRSLMLGYFPDVSSIDYFAPDDLGSIDDLGYLTILGRNSDKIITGGENVYPIEVVNTIMATKLVKDAWVIGLADRYWGQKVVALYVPIDPEISGELLAIAISDRISKYKIPKTWISVTSIPRNSLGKVEISAIEALAINADPI